MVLDRDRVSGKLEPELGIGPGRISGRACILLAALLAPLLSLEGALLAGPGKATREGRAGRQSQPAVRTLQSKQARLVRLELPDGFVVFRWVTPHEVLPLPTCIDDEKSVQQKRRWWGVPFSTDRTVPWPYRGGKKLRFDLRYRAKLFINGRAVGAFPVSRLSESLQSTG